MSSALVWRATKKNTDWRAGESSVHKVAMRKAVTFDGRAQPIQRKRHSERAWPYPLPFLYLLRELPLNKPSQMPEGKGWWNPYSSDYRGKRAGKKGKTVCLETVIERQGTPFSAMPMETILHLLIQCRLNISDTQIILAHEHTHTPTHTHNKNIRVHSIRYCWLVK